MLVNSTGIYAFNINNSVFKGQKLAERKNVTRNRERRSCAGRGSISFFIKMHVSQWVDVAVGRY